MSDDRDADLRLELWRLVSEAFKERTGINAPDVLVKGTEKKGFTVTVQTHVRAPDLSPESVGQVVSESLLAFETHSKRRDEKVKRAAPRSDPLDAMDPFKGGAR